MSDRYPPRGALFSNDRKTSDRHPDYTGTMAFDEATVRSLVAQLKEGKEPTADLVGYKKESRTGKKFLSLAAKPPYVKEGGGGGGGGTSRRQDDPFADPPRRQSKPDPFDDDLPF